jgi:hypothetical protein
LKNVSSFLHLQCCLFGPSKPRTPWGARNIPASASASGEINSLSSHMNKISLGSQDRNLLRSATKLTKPPSSGIQIYLQPHHHSLSSSRDKNTFPISCVLFWWRAFQTGRTDDFLGGISAFLIKMKRNASDAAEAFPQASATLPETPEYKDG